MELAFGDLGLRLVLVKSSVSDLVLVDVLKRAPATSIQIVFF